MKLKDCPFCGSKAVITRRKKEGKFLTNIGCTSLLCICWICTDKRCDCEPEGYSQRQDAIEAWELRGGK